MKKLKSMFLMAALMGALSLSAGVSPHETVSATIGGNKVSITYGRPYAKKPGTEEVRKIWGGLVPNGAAWRMGADQATTLETEKAVVIGGLEVPAGKHTLYMVLDAKGEAKLAVSNTTGQWGVPVDEKHDLGRVDMKKAEASENLGQFTITIGPGKGAGEILAAWEKTTYSVAIATKDAAK